MEKVEKDWGHEEIITNNKIYCGKLLHLKAGHSSSIHAHKDKDETFYILKGKILLEHNGKKETMDEGDSIRIEPHDVHGFTGIENSIIIEFSTHHEDSDTYRAKMSGRAKTVYVDIDGFLCTDKQGRYSNAKPMQENIDKINKKYDDGELIYIWTSRGTTTGRDWSELTEWQLHKWGVKYHKLLFGKPEYDELWENKARY